MVSSGTIVMQIIINELLAQKSPVSDVYAENKGCPVFKRFIVDGYSVKWGVQSIWNESQKSSQEEKAEEESHFPNF